jgi:cytidylate kinase
MTLPLIAIDGPAGAGKTSTARQVAWRLGIPYLDTGALYRAAAWAVLKQKVDPKDTTAVSRTVEKAVITFAQAQGGIRIWVDGTDVTVAIRQPDVNSIVSTVCEVSDVRVKLIAMQRDWARRGFGVMEGRDIGTVVLPHAQLKVFMTARPEIRALRRGKEMGIESNPEALARLAAEIAERDRRDMDRTNSPLRPAPDAVTLDSSEMMFEEQVTAILRLAATRFGTRLYAAASSVEGGLSAS